MSLIISIHQYELKPEASEIEFEQEIKKAEKDGLLKLRGLKDYYFTKGIRGERKNKFASIWIYESKEAWEKLWGSIDKPKSKEEYPGNWKKWEDEVLAPFLIEEPDKITFTTYRQI